MQKNKALIIIVSVLAAVAVALAIFYFFFVSKNPPEGTPGDGIIIPTDTGTGTGGTGGTGDTGTGTGTGGGDTGTGTTPTGTENQPQTLGKLRLLSSIPVAGATMYDKNSETYIRYIERGNGHIYEAKNTNQNPPVRISNTTLATRIHEAFFAKKGQAVIIRYIKNPIDEIQTFYSVLKQSASTSQEVIAEKGAFLPANIISLSVSPNGDKIFYLTEGTAGATGIVANPDGSSRFQVFQSPLNEWLSIWNHDSNILLFTKPSYLSEGFSYLVSSQTGSLKRAVGDIKGLTVLPNRDSTKILYSTEDRLGLEVLNTTSNTTLALSIKTIPEKCVWSKLEKDILFCAVPSSVPAGNYPDIWYQGRMSFDDNFYRINTKTGETKVLLEPKVTAERPMDIINISINEKETHAVFQNKNDMSLWLLDITGTIN